MIDCTSLDLDARLPFVVGLAKRHRPPLALLVTAAQAAQLPMYVDDVVPVTTDRTIVPPAVVIAAPPPPKRPLVEVQAERILELQQVIRSHVDEHLPPSEREGLAALLQRCTLMRGMGLPVDDGALLALLASLGWAESALMLGAEVAARCRACTTLAELADVAVDLSGLGEPPIVSAGEIAVALRGG